MGRGVTHQLMKLKCLRHGHDAPLGKEQLHLLTLGLPESGCPEKKSCRTACLAVSTDTQVAEGTVLGSDSVFNI